MAKELVDLSEELKQYNRDNNFVQKIDCTWSESKEFRKLLKSNQSLPDDVYQDKTTDSFYRLYDTDLTEKEIQKYMTFKQLDYLKSIKNRMNFFVILTLISLAVALIAVWQFKVI